MRNKNRKIKTAICSCMALSALAIIGGTVAAMNNVTASAEGVAGVTADNFKVATASVRAADGTYGAGIRYTITMDDELYTNLKGKEGFHTGVCLTPTAALNGAALTKDNAKMWDATTSGWTENTTAGTYECKVYCYDIASKDYGKDISVVGFVESEGSISYSPVISRSVAYVANEVYNQDTTTNASYRETYCKFTYTLDYGYEVEDKVSNIYYGEKITEETPVRNGYEFAGWQVNGVAYDLNTPVTDYITLTATWTESTTATYTVNYEEQQADGSYLVKKTETLSAEKDSTVSVESTSYTPTSAYLSFNADESTLSGTVAADGSLVLTVKYSYEQVAAYSLDGLNCASLLVTFNSVDDGTRAMLELRNASNESVGKVYATVESNVATFDVSTIDLTGKYAVITVENNNNPEVATIVAKDNITVSVNVAEELVKASNPADVTLSNGIHIYGADRSNLNSDGYAIKPNLAMLVFNANDFDYLKITVKGMSTSATIGADVYSKTSGSSGDKFIFGVFPTTGVVTTFDATVQKSQLASDNRGYYIACKTLGDADFKTGYVGIETITYYKDFALTATNILAVNGKQAEYVAPEEVTAYDLSSVAGDSISVTFDGVTAGTSALLELRNASNEIVDRIYTTVDANNVGAFDVSGKTLDGMYGVFTVEGNNAPVITSITTNNITASVNVAEELVKASNPADVTLSNGIHIYGADRSNLNSDGYAIKPNLAMLVFNANDFDYLKITVKGMSTSATIGADVYSKTSGSSGDKFIFGVFPTTGVVTTFDATVQKSQLASDNRGYYIACKTLGDADFKTGYVGIETITYYKAETLTATTLFAINGIGAEYVTPTNA